MKNSSLKRGAGILLHPTSLPSGYIDIDAGRWLDFLKSAGFSVWQMLPLCLPNFGLSPYQCLSAFALNPEHISSIPAQDTRPELKTQFEEFKSVEAYWLKDFALFMALKTRFAGKPWYEWQAEYKNREPLALKQFAKDNAEVIENILWQQFYTNRQWQILKLKAHSLKIKFFGDMPIFVAHDSADVWANPEYFLLDENKMPTVIAGVPPDYFSKTGQRWGNPHYAWDKMRQNSFKWWRLRVKRLASLFDMLRIDHFRGLQAVWAINPKCETAVDGKWTETPGTELLATIKNMGLDIELVAEDLGIITDEVKKLRKDFNLPGMAVLQFGFEGGEDNPHNPGNIAADSVVYTGTHDNDTLAGWYAALGAEKKSAVMSELKVSDKNLVISKLKDIALAAKSSLVMFPLQDILELDSNSRMNTPGTTENNWQWRFDWSNLPDNLADKLSRKLIKFERYPL